MTKLNLKNNHGFTLLEALVAISILMVAVSAPITIAQKGLSSAIYSKDQMIASYLAQDAIEYIKNKRDQITINDPNFNWNNLIFFDLCNIELNPDGCQIDTIINDPSKDIIFFSANSFLKKDINNFYQYEMGNCVTGNCTTKFSRQIQIKMNPSENNTDEAMVTVTVRWGTDDSTKLVVKALIYNY